jgi:hypothetical protein
MTKRVRIENADSSTHRLVVQTWAIPQGDPTALSDKSKHVLIDAKPLVNVCDLIDVWVHEYQYIIVKEAKGN